MSIKNSIKQQLDSYINKSEIDLINMFNIDISSTTKNKFSIISAAMLGIKGSINKSNISHKHHKTQNFFLVSFNFNNFKRLHCSV